MSRQPLPENVQALEHEHGDVLSTDDKGSAGPEIVHISRVDKESEPVVTKKELWSYYRTSRRPVCQAITLIPNSVL